MMTRYVSAATLGFVVVLAFSWLTLASGFPTVWSPASGFVLLPAYAAVIYRMPSAEFFAMLCVPIAFAAWCLPIFKGTTTVPVRSLLLFALVLLLSITNLLEGQRSGPRYHDPVYVQGVTIVSVALWLGLAVLAWITWRRREWILNMVFHTALFAWYALPTFGELP
jgi:hypothetical protein